MNGYAELHPVTITTRADNLEIIAGYDDEQLRREILFAASALDYGDAETCRWLAVLLAEQIERLEAST